VIGELQLQLQVLRARLPRSEGGVKRERDGERKREREEEREREKRREVASG
jgi:hypothetical protein